MNFTTDPRIGAGVSALLIVLGVVLLGGTATSSAGWGWMMMTVGILGLVANVGLYLRNRR